MNLFPNCFNRLFHQFFCNSTSISFIVSRPNKPSLICNVLTGWLSHKKFAGKTQCKETAHLHFTLQTPHIISSYLNRKFKVVPHRKCHFFLCSFSWTRLAMIRQPSIILIVRFECRTYFRIFHVTSLVSNLICQTGYEVMGAHSISARFSNGFSWEKKEMDRDLSVPKWIGWIRCVFSNPTGSRDTSFNATPKIGRMMEKSSWINSNWKLFTLDTLYIQDIVKLFV